MKLTCSLHSNQHQHHFSTVATTTKYQQRAGYSRVCQVKWHGEELLPWQVPWLSKISTNFSNIAQINLHPGKFKSNFIFYAPSLLKLTTDTLQTLILNALDRQPRNNTGFVPANLWRQTILRCRGRGMRLPKSGLCNDDDDNDNITACHFHATSHELVTLRHLLQPKTDLFKRNRAHRDFCFVCFNHAIQIFF